jgi:hypothetical protein
VVGILTTRQKAHLLVEKVALQEILRYLDQLQVVLTMLRLFAVEPVAQALLQVVLETVQPQAPLVGITVRPQQLPLVSVLETTSKVQIRWQLITITATLPLHQLQQLMLVQLLWVPVVVQALRLAQGLTAIPAGLAEG